MATAGTSTARKYAAKTVILSAGEAVVALSGDAVQLAEDGLPAAIRLMPAGKWSTTKGDFLFDAKAQASVLSAQEKYGNDYFFDYGHASLSFFQVDPAHSNKAAGHFRLTVGADGGLWTDGLQWTDEGRELLSKKAFRYFSPAFRAEGKTGRVTEFINAALTNMPATYRMKPLVMSQDVDDDENSQPEPQMKILLSQLGLSEGANEAEALDALSKLKASHQTVQTQLLALTAKANVDEAMGVLAAWKEAAGMYSTAKAQLEKLEADKKEAELVALVDGAVTAGKLPPSLKEQALTLGRQNLGFVKAFIETLASKVAPGVKLEDKKPEGGVVSPELAAVVAKMGGMVKLEDVAKHQPVFAPLAPKAEG